MGLFVGWWEGLALLGLRSVELSVGQNGSFAKLGFSVGWCGFANVPIGQDTSHPVGTIVQHETCEIPKFFRLRRIIFGTSQVSAPLYAIF